MAENDGFNYGRLMQRALRGLMAEVLGQVAEHGLPGEHHFYIGIDTTHPGVDMPAWLHERHPEEMVIVLQDWFADLAVLGDRFQVTLNFNNRPETLVVPFDAVQTFIDPSAKFGLKFDDYDSELAEFSPAEDAETEEAREAVERQVAEPAGTGEEDEGDSDKSADVVSLDSFRKT